MSVLQNIHVNTMYMKTNEIISKCILVVWHLCWYWCESMQCNGLQNGNILHIFFFFCMESWSKQPITKTWNRTKVLLSCSFWKKISFTLHVYKFNAQVVLSLNGRKYKYKFAFHLLFVRLRMKKNMHITTHSMIYSAFSCSPLPSFPLHIFTSQFLLAFSTKSKKKIVFPSININYTINRFISKS